MWVSDGGSAKGAVWVKRGAGGIEEISTGGDFVAEDIDFSAFSLPGRNLPPGRTGIKAKWRVLEGRGEADVELPELNIEGFGFSACYAKLGLDLPSVELETLVVEGEGFSLYGSGGFYGKAFMVEITSPGIELKPISAIKGVDISGRAGFHIFAQGTKENPSIVGQMWVRGVKKQNIGLEYGELSLSISPPLDALSGDIRAKVVGLTFGENGIPQFTFEAKGRGGKFVYSFSGKVKKWDAKGRGNFGFEGKRFDFALDSLYFGGRRFGVISVDEALVAGWDLKQRRLNITSGRFKLPKGSWEIEGSFSPSSGMDITSSLELRDLRYIVRFLSLKWIVKGGVSASFIASGRLDSPEFVISATLRRFHLEGVDMDSLKGKVVYKDSMLVLEDVRMWNLGEEGKIYGKVPVFLGVGKVSSRKRLLERDMELVMNIPNIANWAFFPSRQFIKWEGGRISVNLTVGGQALAPVPSGEVTAESLAFSMRGMNVGMECLGGKVIIDGDRIKLKDIRQISEKGNIESGGFIELKDFRPVDSKLYVKVRDFTVENVKDVTATLDADIMVEGNPLKPFVTGDVILKKALITVPFQRRVYVGERRDFGTVDIRVLMERNVWLKNEFADMELGGEIGVRMEGPKMTLSGKARVVGGKFYYFDKPFDVLFGEFIFPNSQEMNPELYLDAQTYVSYRPPGEDAREIRGPVRLEVRGTMRNPKFSLQTLPPLPPLPLQDIITLLNVNLTVQDLASFEKMGAVLPEKAVSFYLRTQVLKRLESAVGLDAVDLDASVLGEEKTARLTVGKYIGSNLYLKYTHDFFSFENDEFLVRYYLGKLGSFVFERDERGDIGAGFELRFQY